LKIYYTITLLLLACSFSIADSDEVLFAECKEVSGAAFVVASLKNDGMSADQIRTEIVDQLDISPEVKGIYIQQIEMAFSVEHKEKHVDEYNAYVFQWCKKQLKQ